MAIVIAGAPATVQDPSPGPPGDIHLGWESQETCDGCGSGVSAIWIVFTETGELTLCGEHHRRFEKARDSA